MTKRGKFIVIEGGDGSGKSSVMAYLNTMLANERVIFTHEAGGTPAGSEIRGVILGHECAPETELLLFSADRAHHLDTLIRPALAKGTHVVCDRFSASTYAYQVHGGPASIKKLFAVVDDTVVGKTHPDLYIYLDVPPKIARKRMQQRGRADRIEIRPEAFHEKVRRGYHAYLRPRKHVVIDATEPIDVVTRTVEAVVRTMIAPKK